MLREFVYHSIVVMNNEAGIYGLLHEAIAEFWFMSFMWFLNPVGAGFSDLKLAVESHVALRALISSAFTNLYSEILIGF